MPITPRIASPAAQGEGGTLFVGFELGKSTWLIGLYAPELGKSVSRHKVDGGDVGRVQELIETTRRRLARDSGPVRVVSVYEAGYDGFWLHRALEKAGIENRVIDAASVPVNRRARRVKTDRLDLEQLIRMSLALERGETRACRVVRVPSPAAEDAKRQHRERAVLVAERTAHGNRITGLLMLLGIRGINPRRRDFVEHLETLVTATGEPVPPHTKQALAREYERLCVSERQIREIESSQAAALKSAQESKASSREEGRGVSAPDRAALLLRLRGLGHIDASVLGCEVFYRRFDNRREVASYFGLAPSPYNSGSMRTDQGIGKAGNARARTMAIELTWLWVRHQPESALTQWFRQRTGDATGRIRRIAIIALARKLMIALWRYVTTGMIPQGAVMKPA